MQLKQTNYGHIPVLIETVEKYSSLKKDDKVIDCTLGLGGHSEMFLNKIGKKGILIAFEQDEENLKRAKDRLRKYKNQIIYINSNFVHLQKEVEELKIEGFKLIFFDLGLSSVQVDDPERGFSFMHDGPLDMRYDRRNHLTAELVLKTYSERDLERIFKEYGEERYSKKIAHAIKENLPINSTKELAELIETNIPRQQKRRGTRIHPATRVFQALRIEVNKELKILKETLTQSLKILKPGGRIIVISYHSLEDRIVKRFIKEASKECICPKELPVCQCNHKPELKILTKKPITPEEHEINDNPRARSAKLRAAEKI